MGNLATKLDSNNNNSTSNSSNNNNNTSNSSNNNNNNNSSSPMAAYSNAFRHASKIQNSKLQRLNIHAHRNIHSIMSPEEAPPQDTVYYTPHTPRHKKSHSKRPSPPSTSSLPQSSPPNNNRKSRAGSSFIGQILNEDSQDSNNNTANGANGNPSRTPSSASIMSNGSSNFSFDTHNNYIPKTIKDQERLREAHTLQLLVKYNESVDGGYLAPYGNYSFDKLDYDIGVVKNLIITRRLAPFYTPLDEFDPQYSDSELLRTIDNLPLHSFIPETLEKFEGVPIGNLKVANFDYLIDKSLSKPEQQLMHYQIFKARLYQKKRQWQLAENYIFINEKRIKSKKKHGVQISHADKNLFSDDLKLTIYKNGQECPICFMYYPGPFNYSVCCKQPICTECFVQLKRAPPHFPHEQIDENGNDIGSIPEDQRDPNSLISEPTDCPYCATNNFRVSYIPPTNRRTGIGGIPPAIYKSPPHNEIEIQDITTTTSETSANSLNSNTAVSSNSITATSASVSNIDSLLEDELSSLITATETSSAAAMTAAALTTKTLSSTSLTSQNSMVHHREYFVSSDTIRPNWKENLAREKYKLARKSVNAAAIHLRNQLLESDRFSRNSSTSATLMEPSVDELEQHMIQEAIRQSLQD
ncbi:hypothetical protein TBLA_0B09210 [Henningerozyma blattae CBS 6284]|uniref:Protein SIP5 n=1 Tax=Henningerozyma blattae (strain ATCC 34711 / CBS 6284 / DSM 70876 / NBRC 10599 / NRRL Y-10934 / UCD 77-7) TaxID=1071380 RepID=I2H035_HENB6|nr:hypothetical protein TBLA_0B09210 [Tetrapisispora blattae CBS 6284]CCH59737.1 hypothetical protein TBLA_0B09210 [Tetrapisispora blattae CBS 6284]